MVGRLCKIVMCLAMAGWAGLVAFDNVTDYASNYSFVRHVLSMDTTFPGNALMYRAVTSPPLWRVGYDLIIVGEALTGLLFLAGAVALWRRRAAAPAAFHAAKGWVQGAATVGFLVWFVGFELVGGEWFAMWQSAHWNGQDAAFRFYMTMLAVLVVVNQQDAEVGGAD